jgi:hypothetical protein
MTVPQFAETIIIGGGIAGLACARRLFDSSRPFTLITEDVGGRVRNSDSGKVNLGAYYVRGDYHHVNRFVDLGRSVKQMRILRHDHDRSYTRWDYHLFGHLPQAARFLCQLNEFRLHYEAFKQTCVEMSQARALAADSLLWNLYHEPATRFIQRHRIQDIAHWYIAPVVHGTAFTSVDRLTAFSLLALTLPAVIPVYEFTFRFDLLLAGFEDDLVFDSVTHLTPAAGGGYSIHTRNGRTFAAHHIVVATPIDVSARLINLAPLKNPVDVHTFLLRVLKANRRSPSPDRQMGQSCSARLPEVRTWQGTSPPGKSWSTTTGLRLFTSRVILSWNVNRDRACFWWATITFVGSKTRISRASTPQIGSSQVQQSGR